MNRRQRKYIIVTGGDGGYGNLGDEWLLRGAMSYYGEIIKRYNVVILMANIPKEKLDGVEYVKDNMASFKKRAIPINRIKAVHFYGGGYLNKFWLKEKLWLYDYMVEQGLSKNKFFFTGQGLGPLGDSEAKKVKHIAKQSALFGIRDNHYKEMVGGTFMFDVSVALIKTVPRINLRKREMWVNLRFASHVGINEERAVNFIAQLQRFAKIHRLTIRYFAMIKNKDFDEKKALEKVILKTGVEAEVFERASDYKELINRLKKATLVVTTSYHATLAALYSGVPVAAVYENEYYHLKFSGLKEVFDTPLLHTIDIQSYRTGVLADAINSKDRHLREKIRSLKKKNEAAYQQYKNYLFADKE